MSLGPKFRSNLKLPPPKATCFVGIWIAPSNGLILDSGLPSLKKYFWTFHKMSLSSILLTSKTSKIDTELDALFKSNVTIEPHAQISDSRILISQPSQPLPSPAGPSERSAKKRKPELEAGLDADNVHSKRRKSKSENHPKVAQTVEKPSERKTKTQEPKPVKQAKLGDKGKARKVEEVSDEEEDNSDLERTYLHGKKDTGTEKAPETDSENSENSDDEGTSNLVHESLREGKKARKTGRKIKYVPAEETAEMRDTRTIFIGNLPVEVAQKKVHMADLLSTKSFLLTLFIVSPQATSPTHSRSDTLCQNRIYQISLDSFSKSYLETPYIR